MISFAQSLTEPDVVRILSSPEAQAHIGDIVGPPAGARSLDGRRGDIFVVTGRPRAFVVRFPADESRLAKLHQEERIQRNLAPMLRRVRIPDTRVVVTSDATPVFAVHSLIPGRDWFGYEYASLSIAARERLAVDLAEFMMASHSIPLGSACDWLDIPHHLASSIDRLARTIGKPDWFEPRRASEISQRLRPYLDEFVAGVLDDTAARYAAFEVTPEQLVFGHGDLHGGNITLVDDEIGPRLTGVFDFENAGVFDVHYDFGRLNLIDDDLQARVVGIYEAASPRVRRLDARRIDVYSRAFILYLMGGQIGPDGQMSASGDDSYRKLARLLQKQIEHSDR